MNMICEFFQVFYDGNAWPPRQIAEIRERIASESLQKIRTKFYKVARHVWAELHCSYEPLT